MTESSEGEPDAPSPGRIRRSLAVFKKKSVLLSLAAVAALGIDAAIVVAVSGWEKEAADLETQAEDLGLQVAAALAGIEEADAETVVLVEKKAAAESRLQVLVAEADTEQQLAQRIQDTVAALEKCALDRFTVVRGLWERGSGAVAALEAEANAECAAALSSLNTLRGEIE